MRTLTSCFLLLVFAGCVPQKAALDETIVARFNNAVAESVEKSHNETMAELQEYKSTLQRIEQVVTELQAKSKEVKPPAEPVKSQATAEVSRMPGSNWNVEGNWNYTLIELAEHLRRVHNVNTDGKTMSELQAMHDNLHNGYSAYGAPVKSTVANPIQYYTPRQAPSLFRRTRTYSTCPPGTSCPQ